MLKLAEQGRNRSALSTARKQLRPVRITPPGRNSEVWGFVPDLLPLVNPRQYLSFEFLSITKPVSW
jgi:hypothetical protein